MTYLVTGGTGAIGCKIVNILAEQGQQVIVYDLLPAGSLLEELLSKEQGARVKILQGDVTDLPHLIHTVKKNRVEKIIHMASPLVDRANTNPLLALKGICEGTINVFETAKIFELKKVVWASSVVVFGPPEKYPGEYIPNDALYYPWGVYGACKALNEVLADNYSENYGLDITGIRYTTVYGPATVRGFTGAFVRELMANPALGRPGRVPLGDAMISWLYVEDAARATVLVAQSPRTKTRAFTISGDVRQVRKAAEYVRMLLPEADITVIGGSVPISSKFETTAIEQEVGYYRKWSIEQGFRETINAIRQQHGLPPV